jgi:hypothetical protein
VTSTLSTVTTNDKGLVTSNQDAVLSEANLWIGDATSVPVPRFMHGDANMNAIGSVTLSTATNLTPGTSILSTVVTNSKGLVTSNQTTSLADGNLWIGSNLNVPTQVSISGDATMSNTGNFILNNVSATSTTVPLAQVTSNFKGLTTAVSTTPLTSANIWVGDASDVPQAVSLSGEATLSNTGAITITGPVKLANGVTGNLPIANLNSGTGASGSTYWRGDGTWSAPTVSAGGTNQQVQFNDSGSLAGDSLFTYDKTTQILNVSEISSAFVSSLEISTDKIVASGITTSSLNILNLPRMPASQGDIFYGSGVNTLARLGKNTTATTYLCNGGTNNNPTWGQVSLANGVTGILPVINGGTGLSSSATSAVLVTTAAGIPTYSSTMSNGQLIIGNTGGTPTAGIPTSTSGIIVAGGPGTLALDVPASVTGRNLLYNGSFQVAQRGTSFTLVTSSLGSYTLDRWVGFALTSSVYTISQVAGPYSGTTALRFKRTVGSTSTTTPTLYQSLTRDMCMGMQGQTLTLSYYATAGANYSANLNLIGVTVSTGTNTSDVAYVNYTGAVNVLSASSTITTTRTRYSHSFTVGTTATQISVLFNRSGTGTAGANDYFDLENVQLEISPSATNYQYVPYTEELQRCKYFYQQMSGGSGYGSSGNQIQLAVPPLNMRISPVLGGTGNLTITDGVANYTQSSVSVTGSVPNNNGGWIYLGNFAGITAQRPYIMNTSMAITFSAELT